MVDLSKTPPLEHRERVSHKDTGTAMFIATVKRYEFAQSFISGGIVLDAACGSGVGLPLLAERAVRVVGIDCSRDAMEECREAVVLDNAHFSQGYVTNLPFASATFDLLVSFETVEHIEVDYIFIHEVYRVLKRGGRAIISTPNQPITSPSGVLENPHHVREYSQTEFEELLQGRFQEVEWWGQHWGGKMREAMEGTPVKRFLAKLDPLNLRYWIPSGLYRQLNRWAGFAIQEDLGLQDMEIIRDATDEARSLIAVVTKA